MVHWGRTAGFAIAGRLAREPSPRNPRLCRTVGGVAGRREYVAQYFPAVQRRGCDRRRGLRPTGRRYRLHREGPGIDGAGVGGRTISGVGHAPAPARTGGGRLLVPSVSRPLLAGKDTLRRETGVWVGCQPTGPEQTKSPSDRYIQSCRVSRRTRRDPMESAVKPNRVFRPVLMDASAPLWGPRFGGVVVKRDNKDRKRKRYHELSSRCGRETGAGRD